MDDGYPSRDEEGNDHEGLGRPGLVINRMTRRLAWPPATRMVRRLSQSCKMLMLVELILIHGRKITFTSEKYGTFL